MSPRDALVVRAVLDELANTLHTAVGLSVDLRRESQLTADDAVRLEGSIARAVSALKRLPPPQTPTKGGRR